MGDLHTKLEQGLSRAFDPALFGSTEIVNGQSVTAILGRAETAPGSFEGVYRETISLSCKTSEIDPPVTDGEMTVNGKRYTVGAVNEFETMWIAELWRHL